MTRLTMVPWLACAGLCGLAAHAEAQTITSSHDDIPTLLAMAEACAHSDPARSIGRSGSPLIFDRYAQVRRAGRAFDVTFTERAPTRRPYGRTFRIDVAAGTCDGTVSPVTVAPRRRAGVDQLLRFARACAQSTPFGGTGVGGSHLRYDRFVIQPVGSRWLVRFDETRPSSIPNGLDLVVGTDGSCTPAPME